MDESVGSETFRAIDRMREAATAQWTAGLSPASLALAFFDWSITWHRLPESDWN